MIARGTVDGANDRQFVRNRRLQWKMLAETDARNFRGDRGIRPANLNRSVRFRIPHIQMTLATALPLIGRFLLIAIPWSLLLSGLMLVAGEFGLRRPI